ncbi:hypothetical protein R4M03_04360 [Brachyspira pilosicoli]|uniref:Lipoprotein n=1 Tax=Brachyspira pilosicoli P43/6/78 TaxID=1042417 RepID=A0A3B6W457_BRAPL|nr:hypothetical protein [Brachyspira pilosicoli]AGA67307.1 hypothetical protein BPP43_10715 [Brachyspira pilosicoli P43/6/78]MBW5393192.1 hypothetical protein [Brachyspira pilosicoli]
MKKLLFLVIILSIWVFACLPKPPIAPAKTVTELVLGKDIYVYKDEIVDLNSPKIYEVNGEYYFGDFYYIKNNTVYAIDVSNSRMVIANGSNISSFDLEYNSLETSKISFIDNSSNVYITGYNLAYIGDITITNVLMSLPSEGPLVEGNDVPDLKTYIIQVTNTNYTKVGLVSLNKISPEGKTLYSISSIIDNEYEKVIKLIYLTNDKFAVLKRDDKRVPILDVYNINTGAKENRYILDNVETTDEATMSYREIVDCKYITDKNVLAILTMSIENGKHKEDIIFTTSFDNFNLKEAYKLASRDNALAVGMSDNGRVIYTGMDNGLYFIIKTNPFVSQNFSKEYLGTDDFNKLRGINMFNDSIYGFLFEDGKIKFNNF